MKTLILVSTILIGPAAYAQNNGFIFFDPPSQPAQPEAVAPVAEPVKTEEVAPIPLPRPAPLRPAPVEPKAETPVQAPAEDPMDKWRCDSSKGRYAEDRKDVDAIVKTVLGVTLKNVDQDVIELDGNRARANGALLRLNLAGNSKLRMQMLKLSGDAPFMERMWVSSVKPDMPAKICVASNSRIRAIIDGSQHGQGQFTVNIDRRSPTTIQISGQFEGATMNSTFAVQDAKAGR